MDLKLIERFVQAMVPPEGQQSVEIAFQCLRGEPIVAVQTIGMMIGRVQQHLYSDNPVEQMKATSFMLTGIMIGWASTHPEVRRVLLEEYLERASKMRGDNVVSFHDWKAGRRNRGN